MAVCHELAHVKRADLWLRCVPALAERIFFFPAGASHRACALPRAACDAAVMETLDAAPQNSAGCCGAAYRARSRPQRGRRRVVVSNLKRRIAMLQDVPDDRISHVSWQPAPSFWPSRP
jgi:hypothetical protein